MLARRLIEHDVRFVEVQLGGWDTHYDNFTGVEGRCKEFDQAYAALLTDLEARGKLKDTLVVVATGLAQARLAHRRGSERVGPFRFQGSSDSLADVLGDGVVNDGVNVIGTMLVHRESP